MTTEITHDALLALTSPASSDVEAIVVGQHNNVFDVLGLHQVDGGWAVRLFAPSAERVTVETLSGELLANLVRVHDAGFFVGFNLIWHYC